MNDNNYPKAWGWDGHNNGLLTIERAIADSLDPASLRMVADWNYHKGARRRLQAENLRRVADRLELLGYGRERRAA